MSVQAVNLLFLIRSLNYGGSERQIVALVGGLSRKGMRVAVATFYPGGSFRRGLEKVGVPVFSLGKRSRWGVFGFLSRLFRLVRRAQPRILHSYLGSANILTVLLKPLLPTTKIVWGVRASNMELARYGFLDGVLYWIECRFSRFADLIIVNSHAGRDYAVAHGFPSNKLVMIPNGIDVERFCPDHKAREEFRKKLGIADTESLIGLVGRIDPMKGHATFLRAAAILINGRQNVRFVCVGEGPENYRRTLLSLTEELGLSNMVTWAEATDHMEAIYNALDVATCCSSYGEGFSNAIGEAMACGIPCVVTDVGDSKRIIGDAGSVVMVDDPRALAEAWRRVLDMGDAERMKLGQRARARITQHFSLERLIEATSRALEVEV